MRPPPVAPEGRGVDLAATVALPTITGTGTSSHESNPTVGLDRAEAHGTASSRTRCPSKERPVGP
jgi:hypothetical protein